MKTSIEQLIQLKKMELHTQMEVTEKGLIITRVPTGWIYTIIDVNSESNSNIFVPEKL